ncbi:hypothetical protein [Dehalogenimonas alkenigignens]|uniref:hypothetical protein n=1 Tax=Dehalogenimonas alkenigignens TaxID=1217799 RepID=UPI0011876E34|nr:hypothetical protein [Dehalogenimonas alkenigignens]
MTKPTNATLNALSKSDTTIVEEALKTRAPIHITPSLSHKPGLIMINRAFGRPANNLALRHFRTDSRACYYFSSFRHSHEKESTTPAQVKIKPASPKNKASISL